MAEPDYKFEITHIATGVSVRYKTIALTEFQDNVSTKYNETPVFGRMDPIVTYQGTTRNISFAIRKQNPDLNGISKLSAMQYPTFAKYDLAAKSTNALSISRPPLVRVTLSTLLQDQLCALKGFAFTPLVGFTSADSPLVRYGGGITAVQRNSDGSVKKIVSQDAIGFRSVTMKFNLTILHEEPVGWRDDGNDGDIQRWLGSNEFGVGTLFTK